MWTQTVTPTESRLTLEIPEAFVNRPVDIVLIPTELVEDKEMRRNQLHAFFAQFQADAALLRYERDELYER